MDTSSQEFPLPLLITGVAGVAGYNALHYFRERFPGQVIGIRQKNKWPLTGPDIEPCDAEDKAFRSVWLSIRAGLCGKLRTQIL